MLKDRSSSAIVTVSDIGKARSFYQDVLGLELVDDSLGEVLAFRTGATSLIVYRSDYAGTNMANAVVWGVDDEIETIVAALNSVIQGSGLQRQVTISTSRNIAERPSG